mmetsp:Transcript_10972/g.19832  ORF Transcript_10972/g.19832 Transcript_10972/m.19832 type:complete len:380 (-) Transcript_10972:35-1174(-)
MALGYAIKANPLVGMIKEAKDCGLGAECASIAEVHLALKSGVPPNEVIFDSPAKTLSHLRFALSAGVHVNVDNFQELERIQILREKYPECKNGSVGLRVNPQHGAGSIAETSTTSASSKFGVPLKEAKDLVLAAYENYEWLQGLHVHVGSQGCSADLLIMGAKVTTELAEEINVRRPNQIRTIDIGGGLSVDYDSDSLGLTFGEYAEMLRREVPVLFQGLYKIVTEFGRKLTAKVGWYAAQVEYAKVGGGRNIVLTHAGADMFVRPVYLPQKWHHRIDVHDKTGTAKPKDENLLLEQDIGGPLCFSGDLLAVGRKLPKMEAGDWIVVRDAGAYTLSMYNRHTAQLAPAVYAYEEDSPNELVLLKRQETADDIFAMYSVQ